MLFNSIQFLVFFPIVTLVYIILPRQVRRIWLLAASYYFYMCWNPAYAVLILISTVVTWGSGLWIQRSSAGNRKWALLLCFVINFGILFYFKYFNFFISSINSLFHAEIRERDILLPVGISFYTFQAVGYTIDCYRGDIKAEKNLIRYALFVSFFPQLVAGPIERSGNMMHQICSVPDLSRRDLMDGRRIRDGLILMIWGMFLKLVIADRVSTLVDQIFSRYYVYGTVGLIMGAVGFGLQIYCDFASYSIIAMGSAKVMGFNLMENFNAPYFATSVSDFWRRWHISLSTWFRDYLYIPLGGNRKGKARKCLNQFITFTVSGLWHGANWTFIFWGFLHGCYVVLGILLRPLGISFDNHFHVNRKGFGYRLLHIAITFVLVDFAWIFFRADSMNAAFSYIHRMLTKPDFWVLADQTIYTYGLPVNEMNILLGSVLVLLFMDIVRERRQMLPDQWLGTQCAAFRIVFVLGVLMATIIFGIYGPGFDSKQFIYFQF